MSKKQRVRTALSDTTMKMLYRLAAERSATLSAIVERALNSYRELIISKGRGEKIIIRDPRSGIEREHEII